MKTKEDAEHEGKDVWSHLYLCPPLAMQG